MTKEGKEILIADANVLSKDEQIYLLSKIQNKYYYAIPLFYILAKVHKKPIRWRPIVAGHNISLKS